MNWADPNGITFPILDDNESLLANRWGVSGIPSYTLIGRDMTYIVVNGYASPGQIEEALAEPVPEVEGDMPPALEPGDSADPGDVDGGEDGERARLAHSVLQGRQLPAKPLVDVVEHAARAREGSAPVRGRRAMASERCERVAPLAALLVVSDDARECHLGHGEAAIAVCEGVVRREAVEVDVEEEVAERLHLSLAAAHPRAVLHQVVRKGEPTC